VHDQRIDFCDGVLGGREIVGWGYDEHIPAAADACAGGGDVEAGAMTLGREEAEGEVVGVCGLPDLFGQADRCERAMRAKPLVFSDGRAFEGGSELACLGEGVGRGRGP
jgi:hypothetical protein